MIESFFEKNPKKVTSEIRRLLKEELLIIDAVHDHSVREDTKIGESELQRL